jgi:hypothetical protein
VVQSSRERENLTNLNVTFSPKFYTVIGSMLSKLRASQSFSHDVHSDEYSHGFGDVLFRGRIAIRGARLRC